MRIVETIVDLEQALAQWRGRGETVALVPTMGNLHAGHLSLVEAATQRADRVVVSIFVNPLQFGPGEDFARYPRTLGEDREKLQALGVDLLFTPGTTQIYPRSLEESTVVEVPQITEILCGAHRPGHFRGVTTVVAKLFNLVRPEVAVFGEKDYQQLQVIRRMVAELYFPVKIVSVPTVRESDGLAMSSRNRYLSPRERAKAAKLYRCLCDIRDAITAGERDFPALIGHQWGRLEQTGFKPEYLEIRRADLSRAEPEDRPLLILVAARLGQTRLIDNVGVPGSDSGA